jgi:hypothetical protein
MHNVFIESSSPGHYFINPEVLMLKSPIKICVLAEQVLICAKRGSGTNFKGQSGLEVGRYFNGKLCFPLLILWKMYYLRRLKLNQIKF